MRRNIYEISRWNIYQHRRAAGLPLVSDADSREQRLADELFGRLYEGELDAVPEAQRDADDAAWAQVHHAEVERGLGAEGLAKLGAECRGSIEKASMAAKALLDALPKAPAQASGTARDAADGLDQVNTAGWTGKWQGEEHANDRAKSLAERLKNDERLRKIALLAGRFKRIVLTRQKTRVKRGADEISDVVQGDDLARLLPTELARVASSRYHLLAIRDLMERKCLQYQMTSIEDLGRGPLVLCLDKSTSMADPGKTWAAGDKDVWASAVALALLDMVHRQHRTFILLGFSDDVFYRKVVKPGRPLPEDALFVPLCGGTDVGKVLDLALHACEKKDVMKRADIVVITDGFSSRSTASQIKARAKARGVSILGVGIGVPRESLAPWCTDTYAVEDLSGIDGEGEMKLFGGDA